MEIHHDLEINGNGGRCLVRSRTDSESGTQSDMTNTRAKDDRKVTSRRSWVGPIFTSFYPLLLTGTACAS